MGAIQGWQRLTGLVDAWARQVPLPARYWNAGWLRERLLNNVAGVTRTVATSVGNGAEIAIDTYWADIAGQWVDGLGKKSVDMDDLNASLGTHFHEAMHAIRGVSYEPIESAVDFLAARNLEEASAEFLMGSYYQRIVDSTGVGYGNPEIVPPPIVGQYRRLVQGITQLAQQISQTDVTSTVWRWTRDEGRHDIRIEDIAMEWAASTGLAWQNITSMEQDVWRARVISRLRSLK